MFVISVSGRSVLGHAMLKRQLYPFKLSVDKEIQAPALRRRVDP